VIFSSVTDLLTVNGGSLSRRARRATIAVSPGGDADAGLRYAGLVPEFKLLICIENEKRLMTGA
jgi:hypothetical protein